VSVTSDLAKALDKAYEDKSLKEILDASPAALAGMTDADAEALQKAFNVKTVRQVGTNKFFAFAAARVALEKAGWLRSGPATNPGSASERADYKLGSPMPRQRRGTAVRLPHAIPGAMP
jgi:hypothetical protein